MGGVEANAVADETAMNSMRITTLAGASRLGSGVVIG
jgi:hypothetical protein